MSVQGRTPQRQHTVPVGASATAEAEMLSAEELKSVYGKSFKSSAPPAERAGNRRTLAASGPRSKGSTGTKYAGNFVVEEQVSALGDRAKLFDEFYAAYLERLKELPREPIKVTLPNGNVVEKDLLAWETTPLTIAEGISKNLAKKSCVARVKYSRRLPGLGNVVAADEMEDEDHDEAAEAELWDMCRPLEGDCTLELLTFDSDEGKEVFWHSSSHVLGAALEKVHGAQLTHGPPTNGGFFYDSYMGSKALTAEDYTALREAATEVAKSNAPFQRVILTKSQALQLFASNPFKVHTIQTKVPDDALTTAYRCGPLVDLCRGPHLPTTGKVEAFDVYKHSSSYFLGQVRGGAGPGLPWHAHG